MREAGPERARMRLRPLVRIAFAGALAACSACATPREAATPPAGAPFVVAQQQEPAALNPALINGVVSTEWGELLFQYLVKYDDRGRLIGDAATEVPTLRNGGIARDGRTIRYHLRDGLRFADGTPLTARDCVYSIEAIQDPSHNVQSRYGYDVIAKAEAPDDQTLVLRLKRPFSPLLTVVLAPQGFPIFPKHIVSTIDFNHGDFNAKPLGSGPYVVTRWVRGDRVELRANPYYRGTKPKIERLDVRFVPDPNTAITLLRTNEAGGYFSDLDYGNVPILRAIPGVRVTSTPMNAVGAIIYNTTDALTGDARVRRALTTAIDIRSMIAKTYRGAMSTQAAGRGLFIWAYDRKAYPDVPYDPARARTLLDAAGWTPGADGIRRKNGKRLELLLIIQAATPGDTIIGNSIAQYEHAIGAAVTIKAFNVTQFVAPAGEGGPVYGGKFQMALYSFVNGDDPDTTDQFACANVPPHGYNKSRICDPVLDALLLRGRTEYDSEKRKAIYAKIEALLYREMPIAILYQRPELDTFTTRLRGQTTSLSTAWWNVAGWSLR
ncbi:MAG: peptide ABC transporter substrate-binding protein [Candidatus Elarobacter sp.]